MEPELVSVSESRKMFYDWLDSERPWATPGYFTTGDAYAMMEGIVDAAARCFVGDKRPTAEQVAELEKMLCRVTERLDSHLEDHYDGPCMCAQCRAS